MEIRPELSTNSSIVEEPKGLRFIIECFAPTLEKFVDANALSTSIVQCGLATLEDIEKLTKLSDRDSAKDGVRYLFDIFLQNPDKSPESDIKNGQKFLHCLKISGNPGHDVLFHYIQGSGGIPAYSEEEQSFRKLIIKNLTSLESSSALTSPEALATFMKHFGNERSQQLMKRDNGRFLMLVFALIRTPSAIKKDLMNLLRDNHYNTIADLLEKDDFQSVCDGFTSLNMMDTAQSRTNMDGCRESEEFSNPEKEDVRSVCGGFTSLNMTDTAPARTNMDGCESKEFSNPGTTESHGSSTSSGIVLRPDQWELAAPALAGFNTVIIAPTGSGKTYVAGEIIRNHFDKAKNLKVAFIVDKKNLADQQSEAIEKYLDQVCGEDQNSLSVGKITGDTELMQLESMIDSFDIIVMTAGILDSDYNEATNPAVSVNQFSLMIFDECHHCQKSHPFNKVMRTYREVQRESHENGTQSQERLPQVVGLTATLGTGKANSVEKAVQNGLCILANLNADRITTVQKHQDILYNFIEIPKEMSPIYVERREVDPVHDKITELMKDVEKKMQQLPGYNLIPVFPILQSKDMNQYEQWVITCRDRHCPERVADGNNRKALMVCLEHLVAYYKALCINRDSRSKDACTYLKENFEGTLTKDKENFTSLQWDFNKCFYGHIKQMDKDAENPEYQNPLLVELESLLVYEFKDHSNSRALLFTATIVSTMYLKMWIEQSPRLSRILKPCCLTSETKQGQREVISDKFRQNTYNILIVTSVVEEGFDIPSCNLVFRLNYVPSDCGRIQQRGRIRAKDGRSYFICYGNLKQNELMAKVTENMMSDAVQQINEMQPEDFKIKLKKYQQQDERLCREEKRKQRLKDNFKEESEYFLSCKRCGQDACSSYDIKRYKESQHYVCSQEFCDSKIEVKPHPKPKKIDNMKKIGKLFCACCGYDWGIVSKLDQLLIPIIKIDGFVIHKVSADGSKYPRAKTYKKWKDVLFSIEDVEFVKDDLDIDVDFDY